MQSFNWHPILTCGNIDILEFWQFRKFQVVEKINWLWKHLTCLYIKYDYFLGFNFLSKKRREWVKEREREKQELEEILRLGKHQHFNPPPTNQISWQSKWIIREAAQKARGEKSLQGEVDLTFIFALSLKSTLFFSITLFITQSVFPTVLFPIFHRLIWFSYAFIFSLSSSPVLSPPCCNWSFASAIKSFDIQFLFQGKVVFSLSKCLVESIVIGQAHHQLLLYTFLKLTIIF